MKCNIFTDFGTPVGIYIPYQFIVEQTIRQIVEDDIFENADYPVEKK